MTKTCTRPEAQGSLTSYWTQSSSNNHVQSKTTPAIIPQLRERSLDISKRSPPSRSKSPPDAQPDLQPLRIPPPSIPSSSSRLPAARNTPPTRAPMHLIPQPLASHKIRPMPNTTRPRFNADGELHGKKDYAFLSSSPPRARDEADTTTSPLKPNSIEQGKNMPLPAAPTYNDSRPAATLHTTSVAQVSAANTVHRKTLGVRRSMNGWSSRGGQGFSVPGRARHEL